MQTLVSKYTELVVCEADILSAYEIMKSSYVHGGKSLFCGNGGSASDSEHIVGELMKGFMSRRPLPESLKTKFHENYGDEGYHIANRLQGALPAISLVSHTALITAFINDVDAELMYAQQVYGYGRPGDVLVGLSTSGNSKNVLKAVQVAKVMGLKTIGLTGKEGGRMKEICDVTICVPLDSTPDIQERHLPIYHAICVMLEEYFFA
jgi:D-sedoheptulose 7-phosphate isomerase